jgi:hypothetical protein
MAAREECSVYRLIETVSADRCGGPDPGETGTGKEPPPAPSMSAARADGFLAVNAGDELIERPI